MTLRTLIKPRIRACYFLFPLLALQSCSKPDGYDPVFATAEASIAPLTDSVLATGTIQTVTSVEVSSQLSGRIDQVSVDFNDLVTDGQPLATLDRQRFASRVEELNTALAVANAEAASATAALKGVEAEFEEAERDLARKEALFEKGSISISLLDEARTRKRQSRSAVLSSQAQLQTKRAAISVARASLRQAEIDLERTVIRAPIDGIVIKRSIEPGQTVAASLEAPELFVIAHDLKLIEVHASVDEADIGKIRAGQSVVFRVDAYPERSFEGRVSQIRKAPEIVQNVVTYTVVIDAQNPDELMLPGMTAVVEIISAADRKVLQIPNAALRFEMPTGMSKPSTAQARPEGSAKVTVWAIGIDGEPEQRNLEIGYSNGEFTEVLAGSLAPGDKLIIGYRH